MDKTEITKQELNETISKVFFSKESCGCLNKFLETETEQVSLSIVRSENQDDLLHPKKNSEFLFPSKFDVMEETVKIGEAVGYYVNIEDIYDDFENAEAFMQELDSLSLSDLVECIFKSKSYFVNFNYVYLLTEITLQVVDFEKERAVLKLLQEEVGRVVYSFQAAKGRDTNLGEEYWQTHENTLRLLGWRFDPASPYVISSKMYEPVECDWTFKTEFDDVWFAKLDKDNDLFIVVFTDGMSQDLTIEFEDIADVAIELSAQLVSSNHYEIKGKPITRSELFWLLSVFNAIDQKFAMEQAKFEVANNPNIEAFINSTSEAFVEQFLINEIAGDNIELREMLMNEFKSKTTK